MFFFLLCTSLFILPSDAFTSFNTNCTLPLDTVNYVSSPNTRGTLTILWTCLFTIVSCTWTVKYPDVPWQREHYRPGRMGDMKCVAQKYFSQILWFLVTLLAPEVLLAKYWHDILTARRHIPALKALAMEDGVEWTLTHSLFANMGGFVVRDSPVPQDELSHRAEERTCSPAPPSVVHTTRVLPRLPAITQEELRDRSKADGLMRLITVIQILWMCTQVIARSVSGLAVSQLEISVVAFASCAVVMYWLCWEKPKGVQIPITLLQVDALTQHLAAWDDPENSVRRRVLWEIFPPEQYTQMFREIQIAVTNTVNEPLAAWGVILAGPLFGGVHLIAWDFVFPSNIERLLWRMAAIYCTCFPVALPLLALCTLGVWRAPRFIGNPWLIVYTLARLYLLVEMFRTLAYLPVDTYRGTWTVNMPYFG
ncbi:hypothetical protein BP00DRAFT_344008 [Aspergillus indologenus CBS 114.80]|uniref:Integral membrane protein n=1 Tax=Aspergillus indologenus CBS 114.80 TaxID=1450541 RepID=A0A2V5I5M3_9EURO|nr:hypothetical protein BP00DRAFT_344008 [Aspergillus indologenus CBS 114.80]